MSSSALSPLKGISMRRAAVTARWLFGLSVRHQAARLSRSAGALCSRHRSRTNASPGSRRVAPFSRHVVWLG